MQRLLLRARQFRGLALVAASAALVLGLTVACVGMSGHVGVAGKVPTPGGGEITFNGSVSADGTQPYQTQNNTGKCFKLKFYDKDGNQTGEADVGAGGGGGSVPAGSTSYGATEQPCGGGGSQQQSGGYRHSIGWNHLRYFTCFGLPLRYDENSPTGNASYSFVVRAHDQAEADLITQATLRAPMGQPIDPRVQVLWWSRVSANASGAHVYSLSRTAFRAFEMDFNGTENYAVLGVNATQSEPVTGVFVVDAPVALSDVQGFDHWNSSAFRYQLGGAAPETADYSIVHYSQ